LSETYTARGSAEVSGIAAGVHACDVVWRNVTASRTIAMDGNDWINLVIEEVPV
jgi:hypothetical protein